MAAAGAHNRRIGLALLFVLVLVLVIWIVVLTITAAIAGRWLEAALFAGPLLIGVAAGGTMFYLSVRDNRRAVAMAEAATPSIEDSSRSRWVRYCLRLHPQRRLAVALAATYVACALTFAVGSPSDLTWLTWVLGVLFAVLAVPAVTAAVVRTRDRLPDTPIRKQ